MSKKKNRNSTQLAPITAQPVAGTPTPRFRLSTQEWFMAGSLLVSIIAVGVSIFALSSQRGTDAQIEQFKTELKRLGDSAEWMRQAEFAPHPTVETPIQQIAITGPDKLMQATEMTIRNTGRGNCYDLSARVVYESLAKSQDQTGHLKNGDIQQKEVGPFDVLKDITMAPGDRKPFRIRQWPLYPTENPQGLTGRVEMKCRDESGKLRFYVQPFTIVVHLEKKSPHAHFYFQSPISVEGQVYPLGN